MTEEQRKILDEKYYAWKARDEEKRRLRKEKAKEARLRRKNGDYTIPVPKFTENEIIRHLFRWKYIMKYVYKVPNVFMYEWESDLWVMDKNGVTVEFEIKTSRSDFFNDFKKEKHLNLKKGANHFFFVVPYNLIKREELNEKYGLIYIKENGSFTIIRKSMRFSGNYFTNWKYLASKMYRRWERMWCETTKNRMYLDSETINGYSKDMELFSEEQAT